MQSTEFVLYLLEQDSSELPSSKICFLKYLHDIVLTYTAQYATSGKECISSPSNLHGIDGFSSLRTLECTL